MHAHRRLCFLVTLLFLLWTVATDAQVREIRSQHALRLDSATLVQRIDPASATDLVANQPSAAEAAEPVKLPLRLRRDDGNATGVFWFEITLPGRDALPAEPAIMLPRLTDGGTFYLNGSPVFTLASSDALTRVRWRRARSFALPPALLKSETNRLSVKLISRDFVLDMPHLLVGEADELQKVVDERQWFDQYGSQFTGFTAVIVGCFVLAIWWSRRSERYYLLFGLSSLLWAVRTLNYSVETMPADLWWWWRGVHFLTVALATLTLGAFFHFFAGLSFRRWWWPALAYCIAGPIAVVASDGALHDFVYRYWQAPLFLFIGIALSRLALWGHRRHSIEALVITIGVLVATALAANDYATVSGLLPTTRAYTLHFALPVLLVTIGALLTMRFVRALRAVEDANLVLAERLASKERELADHYARLTEIERREASTAERQRIMHDMHDGLGAQLLSSLIMVERGSTPTGEVARLLREAIDEMRLAIDAFGQSDVDLTGALASLRHRMEPRLKAAGLTSHWWFDDAFDRVRLTDEHALQLLRIVQEGLSNAMRHSKGRRLQVSLVVDPPCCRLTIVDDGVGLPAEPRHGGRGLENIRRRAHSIGGEASVVGGPDGTIVTVEFPLPADFATAAHRTVAAVGDVPTPAVESARR